MLPYFPTSPKVNQLVQAINRQDLSWLRRWSEDNDPNHGILGHWTPIHLAVVCGKEAPCQVLLEAGAKPSPKTNAPRTPLMLAAELGNEPIVGLLIQAGAQVNEVSFDGFTALSLACGSALGRVEQLIMAGADLNWVDGSGYTPLVRATLWCPQLVSTLLAAGADPNCQLQWGTVMSVVADVASNNTIKHLILAGADINAKAQTGERLMYILAKRGSLELCKMLIEKGVDPSCETLRHNGKLPHEVAVGETSAYLSKVVQAKHYLDRLTEVAGRGRGRQLDEQGETTVLM